MLTIYRASAGTGKTHTLTGEYLRLLFAGTDMHARILSVTFTNKATEEMKSRILKEIHELASGQKSDYLEYLITHSQKAEEQIRSQARHILIRILHDYTSFHISTIDHFFQQTIRAFIREIGIQSNYRIEMDKDLVLSESIDNLLSDLDKDENKDLLDWLLRFSEEKVEKGENWDLRNEIKMLSNELFKEKYKYFSERINQDIVDKSALVQYKDQLYAIIRSVETEARQMGEEGLSILSKNNLTPSDFKGGSRSPLFFFEHLSKGQMKTPSATFVNLVNQPEAFYTKTTSPELKQTIETAFHNGLNGHILRTIQFFNQLANYYTAKEIVRHYYTLGILTDIARHIKAWREEKNRMLIADTNELLDKVINGSDVPFIYEKIGTRIDHYMIDEFQDTSVMQWRNFRPLIKESLAYDRSNLIVGDVKQSIYRFRNSDWSLLDEQVRKEFLPTQVSEKTLNVNWRSHPQIVEFNNTFFTLIPLILQNMFNEGLKESELNQEQQKQYASKIVSAYNNSFELVAPPNQSKDGHIRIDFLPDTETCSWKEEAMNRLPGLTEQLQANGYELRDIAILVRTKAEGAVVAKTLLSYKEANPDSPYGFDIISEDALVIGNSYSVRFLISMLQHLSRPNDEVIRKHTLVMHAILCKKGLDFENEEFLPEEFKQSFSEEQNAQFRLLSQCSLYEMVEGIYRLFQPDFPENEQVYIQAFLDLVTIFVEKEPAQINQFLNWWKETGRRERIVTPDSQNAIRILTIHKSKGLGIKVVIIPFGDWDIDQKSGSILWCHPTQSPFDQMHLVPVRYSKELNKTIFAEDFYHEKLYAYIDNLNALYVAFTRAKEELIVFAPDDTVKRRKTVSKLIWEALQPTEINQASEGYPLQPLYDKFQSEEAFFEWGSWNQSRNEKRSHAKEVPMHALKSVLPDQRMHIRLQRKGCLGNDKQRKYGILMHELLSQITTLADIEPAIKQKVLAGELSRQEAEELSGRFGQLLTAPEVKHWFDGSMQVMNEAEILLGNGRMYRPDRIMLQNNQVLVVDYKFGEQKKDFYNNQVRKYLQLIREMGYEQVKGYLWYIELNEIASVGI